MEKLWKAFRISKTALYVMAILASVALLIGVNSIVERVIFAIFCTVIVAYFIMYTYVWYTPDLKHRINFGDKFAFCVLSGVIFVGIKEYLWP